MLPPLILTDSKNSLVINLKDYDNKISQDKMNAFKAENESVTAVFVNIPEKISILQQWHI